MSVWVALAVFAMVFLFSIFVLRVSGAWMMVFSDGPQVSAERQVNPLASSPRGWIENHEFWDLVDETNAGDDELDAEQAFWGSESNRDVG